METIIKLKKENEHDLYIKDGDLLILNEDGVYSVYKIFVDWDTIEFE